MSSTGRLKTVDDVDVKCMDYFIIIKYLDNSNLLLV